MTNYNPAQVAALAHIGGWTGKEQIVTATAVALAESRGDQNATHKNTNGSTDYGIWQVNDKAHPDKIAEAKSNAIGNARAAYKVWAERHSFSPWSTYKSGAYKEHMMEAELAYNELQTDSDIEKKLKAGGGATDSQFGDVPTDSPLNGVSGAITGGFNAFNKAVFGVAINAGVFIGAIVLLILGILIILRQPIASGISSVVGVKKKATVVKGIVS